MQMPTPESAPLALAALALIALVLIGWRAVRGHRPGDGPGAVNSTSCRHRITIVRPA